MNLLSDWSDHTIDVIFSWRFTRLESDWLAMCTARQDKIITASVPDPPFNARGGVPQTRTKVPLLSSATGRDYCD